MSVKFAVITAALVSVSAPALCVHAYFVITLAAQKEELINWLFLCLTFSLSEILTFLGF